MSYQKIFSALALTALVLLPNAAHARNDRHDNRGHGNPHHNNGRDKVVYQPHYGLQFNRPAPAYYHQKPPKVVYAQPRTVYYSSPTYYYNPPVYRNVTHYYIGAPAPIYRAVPQHVMYRLRPAPYGHYYTMDDRNVYLVSQRNNTIADIINLLF